jgi:hypothetical protein
MCDSLFEELERHFAHYAKVPNINQRSKPWWNEECRETLRAFQITRTRIDRKAYFRAIRQAKRTHFDKVIQDTCARRRVWDLTAWTKARPINTTSHISMANGQLITSAADFVEGCKTQFFSAANRPIDMTIVEEIASRPTREFYPFSAQQVRDATKGTSSASAPGPDHLTWPCIKAILTHDSIAQMIARLFTSCIQNSYWPSQLKASLTVVIPKPNKQSYVSLKAYRPIVLLSCLGKLGEKIIADYIQFDCIKYSLLHPAQCGGVRHHSTEDAGILLTNHIRAARKNQMHTTCLAMDIAQFFPSINHILLVATLERMGFPQNMCAFFAHYLQDRSTRFMWNGVQTDPADCSVGVGQGSALSPILSALAIVPSLTAISQLLPVSNAHLWISLLVYVDDGTLTVSSNSLTYNALQIQSLYPYINQAFTHAGIFLEPDKLETMHFPRPRYQGPLPTLHIQADGREYFIEPKDTWRYLGFFFDPQLSFKKHVNYYSTQALSTVRSYPLLGNSNRGLTPQHKRLLYLSCILPIMTYGFRLWYQPQQRQKTLIKTLSQAQHTAAKWIIGAFRTSPRGGTEILAGLLPLHLHLRKLFSRSVIRFQSLPHSHILQRATQLSPPRNPLYTYAPIIRNQSVRATRSSFLLD